jgi:hypothetical protein
MAAQPPMINSGPGRGRWLQEILPHILVAGILLGLKAKRKHTAKRSKKTNGYLA